MPELQATRQLDAETEEEEPFKLIETLEKHGVSATVRSAGPRRSVLSPLMQPAPERVTTQDVKKLKEAGFNTVGSVIMECKKKLTIVRGLSEAKVEKIMEAASKTHVRG